jgi:hypothetical protein
MKTFIIVFIFTASIGCSTLRQNRADSLKEATSLWAVQTESVSLSDANNWPNEIKNLDPIGVYSDRVNVVIVIKREGNVEEGFYVYIPISSHLPSNNKEWTLVPLGKDIWAYKRIRSEQGSSGNG